MNTPIWEIREFVMKKPRDDGQYDNTIPQDWEPFATAYTNTISNYLVVICKRRADLR